LSDSADPQTRTYEARYVMDGDGAAAPLGATVTLTLNGARQATIMQVPLGAIDDEGKGAGVWVLDRPDLPASRSDPWTSAASAARRRMSPATSILGTMSSRPEGTSCMKATIAHRR